MASTAIIQSIHTRIIDDGNETDYGSDFSPEQEEIVERLLSGQVVEEDNPIASKIEHHDSKPILRLPRVYGREERSPLLQAARAAERVAEEISRTVEGGEYQDLSDQFRIRPKPEASPVLNSESTLEESKEPDTRTPLERFRTKPKKSFSVSDFASPAWCELQYWYTLTLPKKRKKTPAMWQGSAVHKVLEEQVHRTVRVQIGTREDAWGLRIWNVIQGLRTLRTTGLTRELEIWGIIDGQIVTGVIDELSYICPDTELEASIRKSIPEGTPPADQATISDFFKAIFGGTSIADATKRKTQSESKKIYLCDVKTRGAKSKPSLTAFQPTKIQLMLYHRLLAELATNTVDFVVLAARYNLDGSKIFSDAFIAQVGSLNDEQMFFDAPNGQDSTQESDQNWSQDSMSVLLAHNTLTLLWDLMMSEFQLTFPNGTESLGSILKAEYRSRDDGEIIGTTEFVMDDEILTKYLDYEMKWWRGEREPQGVNITEAYKCRSCDFADECEWRISKEKKVKEDAKEKARIRRSRKTSAI